MVLGYLDAATPPVIEVDSGDTVTLVSFPAGGRASLPDGVSVPADYLAALDALPPGPGPHFLTGPVYVRGAAPGDTLQIDILDAKPTMEWGLVSILPLLGTPTSDDGRPGMKPDPTCSHTSKATTIGSASTQPSATSHLNRPIGT